MSRVTCRRPLLRYYLYIAILVIRQLSGLKYHPTFQIEEGMRAMQQSLDEADPEVIQ